MSLAHIVLFMAIMNLVSNNTGCLINKVHIYNMYILNNEK